MKHHFHSWVSSLSLPLALLLHGLVFPLGGSHILGIQWSTFASVLFYTGLAIWILAIVGTRLWLHRWIVSLTLVDAIFIAFLACIFTSLYYQSFTGDSIEKYIRYMPIMLILPYLAGKYVRLEEINRLNTIFLFMGIVMLLPLYWTILHHHGIGRPNFLGMNDHGLARISFIFGLASVWLISLYFMSLAVKSGPAIPPQPNKLCRSTSTIFLLGSIVFICAIALSGIRTHLLASFICIGFICLFARWVKPKQRLITFALFCALLPIAVISLGNNLPTINLDINKLPTYNYNPNGPITTHDNCGAIVENVDSLAIRITFMHESIAMLLKNPWFGVGATNFGAHSCLQDVGYPHSVILQAFAELGFVGGSIFISLILTCCYLQGRKFVNSNYYKTKAIWLSISALTLYFLIFYQSSGNIFSSIGLYLMLGLSSNLGKRKKVNLKFWTQPRRLIRA